MTRKNITLSEVASAAQVSLMTASRAINNRPGVAWETRKQVLQAAARLGYVGNRVIRKPSDKRRHLIGVVAVDPEDPYMVAVIASIEEAAWEVGYRTRVCSRAEREKHPSGSAVQLLRENSDGIIAILPLEARYVAELASIDIPVVTIDHTNERADLPSVITDCYDGARAAVRHLIELGHRRIGYVAGDERVASARERRHAYVETLVQHGLDVDPELIVVGDFSERRGFAATTRLLALPQPPTAIFAANDMSAFGAIAAIHEAGLRVPDDMSVVGFDDIPPARRFSPALTTVRQPLSDIGRSAVNSLLEHIAGITPAALHATLPTEMVVRDSTASPR